MQLGFITSNQGKLQELQTSLAPLGHEVIQLKIDYPELQANSIEAVAQFGLEWIKNNTEPNNAEIDPYKGLDLIFLEDSGLFIEALNNFPGVYSKFVFTTIGLSGILDLLKNEPNRNAHFESCIAVCAPNPIIGTDDEGNKLLFFKGISNGTITTEPRGNMGFGFDPIFKPKETEKTFAEMTPEIKNRYSHRGAAIDKFAQYLNSI